ncbi:ABC transporter ATP-binding protein [Mycoplasmatota bacterium]|nr:ABC transporter ATP-binding protein [Mycoplasmatota bacterium]
MNNYVIKVKELSKVYKIYNSPKDRLKESLSIFRHKKYHNEFYSLNDVSFNVKKGETLGIIGKNGAGKSTLLKLVTGIITPTTGDIEVQGTVSALLELGAGFNMEYTGIENIYLNGILMGFSREEMNKKIDDIINFADIGNFIHQPVKTYSTGMFVRLAFATAINVEPEILIVDEALAVGDLQFSLKCMDKFTELMEKGVTILFVSHDLNAVKRFCKKAIWLHEGKVMEYANAQLVCEHYESFLKKIDDKKEESEPQSIVVNSNNNIAEIKKIELLNSINQSVDTIVINEKTSVKITYEVLDTSIKNPVLGIAIYGIDNKYICGLNTLLDKVKISWNKGINEMTLVYDQMMILGGQYYFDVAIFDQTGTVPINYISKVKEFWVKGEYIGEGVFILPHEWS